MNLSVVVMFPVKVWVVADEGKIKQVNIVRESYGSGITARGQRIFANDMFDTKEKAIKRAEKKIKQHLKINEVRRKFLNKMIDNLNEAKVSA